MANTNKIEITSIPLATIEQQAARAGLSDEDRALATALAGAITPESGALDPSTHADAKGARTRGMAVRRLLVRAGVVPAGMIVKTKAIEIDGKHRIAIYWGAKPAEEAPASEEAPSA
jgi:hypothetical protein